MADKYEGFVSIINELKSKPGANRAWTAYSFKIEDVQGKESDTWFNFGFDKPPFVVGDYIKFEGQENDRGYLEYIKGSGERVKNPPARAGGRPAASPSSGADKQPTNRDDRTTQRNTANSSESVGADRQTQIVMQHSQEMAVQLTELLLKHDALPISSAQTKAGEAKRFAEITAAVDKLTVRLYQDVVTARLLETVTDTGIVSTAPDGPLPDAPKEPVKRQRKSAVDKAAPAQDDLATQDDDDATSSDSDDSDDTERFE